MVVRKLPDRWRSSARRPLPGSLQRPLAALQYMVIVCPCLPFQHWGFTCRSGGPTGQEFDTQFSASQYPKPRKPVQLTVFEVELRSAGGSGLSRSQVVFLCQPTSPGSQHFVPTHLAAQFIRHASQDGGQRTDPGILRHVPRLALDNRAEESLNGVNRDFAP